MPDLIATVENYLAAHNNDPKPFVWTAPHHGRARNQPVATDGGRSPVLPAFIYR